MSISQPEAVVRQRYSAAAGAVEPKLCCPVQYDPEFLAAIPAEVLEKDYGCGDPSQYLNAGETVLDLGSGTGKICFIASQVVGARGRVIGVDMTDAMLEVARRNAPSVAERIGYANVEFRKGLIQDLALDLEQLDAMLLAQPVVSSGNYFDLQTQLDDLRQRAPLIATESIDVVVSSCVLNLVAADAKTKLFGEIFRVLKRGGRAVISDIVSDEDVPRAMQDDPELWSGCVSGALREDRFLEAFEAAGFHGVTLRKRDVTPWRRVQGIEFRSVTVEAFKGKQGPCWERNQAVVYKGPWRSVTDDDNHRYDRGKRHAVCDKTFQLLKQAPYAGQFECIEPVETIPLGLAQPFDCSRSTLRHPHETKNGASNVDTTGSSCCEREPDVNSCCSPTATPTGTDRE